MLIGNLHPYQNDPVDAALARGRYLMAVDMGLGKTVMAIAVAEELLGCGDIDLCLIVCPGSLRTQWAKALAKFTDLPQRTIKVLKQSINVPISPEVVIIDGRAFQKNKVKYSPADDRKRQYDSIGPDTQYVILSYESLLSDARWINRIKPGLVICDEITAAKTFRAKRAKALKKILDSEYRLGLTGTPIENGNPSELFSLMQWVDDTVLGRWDLYDKTYIVRDPESGIALGYKNLGVLRAKLEPAMSRLTRHDPGVRDFIPDEEMDDWPVPLEGPVRAAYMEMGRRLHAELKAMGHGGRGFDVAGHYGGQADESTRVGKVMAVHTAMEQLLAHPDLVVMSGMAYEKSGGEKGGSKFAHQAWQDGLLDDCWDSPKLEYLKLKLAELTAFGGKVLVFSKFRPMLQIIADSIGEKSVQYHGQMNAGQKAAAVEEFTRPDGPRVLLSSHAGAYGVDMNMADHLINYDNSWMSGRADQINSRHVRASSEFTKVYIHNLIVSGSIEERIMAMQEQKRKLAEAITDGKGPADGRIKAGTQSLTSFLENTIEDL